MAIPEFYNTWLILIKYNIRTMITDNFIYWNILFNTWLSNTVFSGFSSLLLYF